MESVETHVSYLWRCLKDSLDRGEEPLASHALYPQILDDTVATERKRGIEAGYKWMEVADAVIFYTDYGWSPGMKKAKKHATKLGKFVASRTIGRNILKIPLVK